MARHQIQGSERHPLPNAVAVAKADPVERLEVTVVLHHRNRDGLKERITQARQHRGQYLSREDFEKNFGADPADVAAVRKFANTHNLVVVHEHTGARTVVLSGTVAQFNEAFGVDLHRFEHPGGSYRGRTGPITVPDELSNRVQAVLGLDDRPIAKPHFRNYANRSAPPSSFTPPQLASLYKFPAGQGENECVGIIELGGGERPADLRAYFSEINVNATGHVTVVSVDHGKNRPTGGVNGPDGEVMLDIEVVGAVAPAANIAVYFAPNTDAGFLDAITAAVHDTTNKPSVISISWGGPESSWTQQALTAYDSSFQAAAAMGITICVASGDNGSSDGVNDNADHVDFPGSSPHVLACGGTSVKASNNAISQETVWNDGTQGGATGGGISTFFDLPDWQNGIQVTLTNGKTQPLTRRGVPDVCGDADPQTGYQVRVDGTDTVIGGTSAVAPLWAGLIARINSKTGAPSGFINPILYQNPGAVNPITSGNNGTFAANPEGGWSACTGLGSPNGAVIEQALSRTAARDRLT